MPRSHDVLRDEDAVRLLATLLRVRPQTVGDLHEIRALPVDRLTELLEALVAAGFLRLDGDRIELLSPEEALADQVDALGAATSLLARLARHRDREDAAAGSTDLAVEVVRGRQAQWRAWERYAVLAPPRSPLTVYPSAVLVREASATPGSRHRALLPASALENARDREVVESLVAARVEVRLTDDVESWVYVDPGVLAAIPLTWGEGLPSSMVFVRDEALLAPLSAYAERLWEAGRPYALATAPWAPVLAMMARGHADPDIAKALRISLRGVQRRISEAMGHYDVDSRFELGAAWATDRRPA